MTKSESLFVGYCDANGIPYRRIPQSTAPTPDFVIQLGHAQVVCEVKELSTSEREKQAWRDMNAAEAAAYIVQNRLRRKLKNVSRQVKTASSRQMPTMVVVFDNTPFQDELDHESVVQALYGTVAYPVVETDDGELALGAPFFGGDRGLTPTQNTSVSVVAVLEKSDGDLSLRLYHNLHAAVVLDPNLLYAFPGRQVVLPGDTTITV